MQCIKKANSAVLDSWIQSLLNSGNHYNLVALAFEKQAQSSQKYHV